MKWYVKDLMTEPEDIPEDIPPEVGDEWPDIPREDEDQLVCELAEYYYDHMDGWEDQWPLTFVLVDSTVKEKEFRVELELEPQFYITAPIKE